MTLEFQEAITHNVFQSSSVNENAKTQFPSLFSYSLLLNNIFLCIDHSANIFIYYSTNPRFKKDLLELLKTNVVYKLFKK